MKKFIFIFTLIISLFTFFIDTSALETKPYKLTNIVQYSSAKFHVTIDNDGNNIVKGDTSGFPKGYYTSFINSTNNIDLSNFAGLWFSSSNIGKSDVSISLNIVDNKGRQTNLKTGAPYLLELDNIKYSSITDMDALLIKAGETKRIYIPISSLNTSSIDLKHITKLGYFVTLSENSECNLKLGNFQLLNQSEAAVYQNSLGAKIVGDAEMQIAVQGESITNLVIDGSKNNTFKFQPLNDVPGITLTPDGILTSTSTANEETLKVTAKDAAGVVLTHEVKLYKSWRVTDEANSLNHFTTSEEVVKPDISFTKYFSPSNLIIIRIIGSLILFILFTSYFVIKRNSKKTNKEV